MQQPPVWIIFLNIKKKKREQRREREKTHREKSGEKTLVIINDAPVSALRLLGVLAVVRETLGDMELE